MRDRPQAPVKLVAGLAVLLLGGLWFLAGGATDIYLASVLLHRTKQGREYQIAEATVLSLGAAMVCVFAGARRTHLVQGSLSFGRSGRPGSGRGGLDT